MIDIGGPAMLRSAAKNHRYVTVVTDVEDYAALLAELDAHAGATSPALPPGAGARRLRAHRGLRRGGRGLARRRARRGGAAAPCHRRAGWRSRCAMARTRTRRRPSTATAVARPGVASARQLQGKALSYNNINDTDAAFELVAEFDPADGPACAIIKHANPCGVARGATLAEAYRAAYDCDRSSAFGGIVALNQALDAETAAAIGEIFTEVVIAPDATAEAAKLFAHKKNLRLLVTGGLPDPRAPGLAWRQVAGGFLVQDRDAGRVDPEALRVVTRRAPTAAELGDLRFAWTVAKHVKSNAVVYARGGATVGIGAGQMSRVDATRIAAAKARDMAAALGLAAPPTVGAVVASDAFFPFADGLIAAAEAGATAVIQPGGSVRDAEVVAAADAAGLAMVFTGMRHFRH